jgi:hypothetical protein
VAQFFRDPVQLTFIDADNVQLAQFANPTQVPRVGENVRLAKVPYVVERVGYDYGDDQLVTVWIVCRPA